MGLRLVKTALIALLALGFGYAVALGAGLIAFEVFDVSQREGANAMALAFVICPVVAVSSAVVAAIWYWIASGRRAKGPTAVGAPRRNAARVVAIAVSVVVGWLAGSLLQWVLAGHSYETFLVALAVSTAPWLGAIVLAGITWWLTLRREAPRS